MDGTRCVIFTRKYAIITMVLKEHTYSLSVQWTGNRGSGTSDYRTYSRDHLISGENKPEIQGSSDPAFRGDKNRYNPEELLISAISSCHMLWFLHLCAVNHIIVTAYVDHPAGIMEEKEDGSGRFKEVTLHPDVMITDAAQLAQLDSLHEQAHALCFIANSVSCPVHIRGTARLK